jgi:hypothetical protein
VIFGRYAADLGGSCVTRGYAKLNPDLRCLLVDAGESTEQPQIVANHGLTRLPFPAQSSRSFGPHSAPCSSPGATAPPSSRHHRTFLIPILHNTTLSLPLQTRRALRQLARARHQPRPAHHPAPPQPPRPAPRAPRRPRTCCTCSSGSAPAARELQRECHRESHANAARPRSRLRVAAGRDPFGAGAAERVGRGGEEALDASSGRGGGF